MDRELEVIHDQMEGTRASLADKLGLLESQVRGTVTSTVEGVKEVVDAVTDKVEGVVESVTGTVESVTESVADTFNINKHVEQHPWVSVGVAVAVGFAAAQLLPGSRKEWPSDMQPTSPPSPAPSPTPAAAQSHFSAAAGGMLEDAWKTASTGIQGLAVGGLMSFLRELAEKSLPTEWKHEVSRFVDDVTTQLGGKPLPAVKHEEPSQPATNGGAVQPASSLAPEQNTPEDEGRTRRESRRGSRQSVGNVSP